jgi:acyl-CoA thioesterase II
MSDLERATRLSGERGSYTITLSEDWKVFAPHGGYLTAIALRAAGKVAQIQRPSSMYCHFLRVAEVAEVELQVVPLAQGKRTESLRVVMTQQGKVILEAMVRTAQQGPGVEHVYQRMPDVAPPHGLPRPAELRSPQQPPPHPMWSNFDRRVLQRERFDWPTPRLPPYWLEWFRLPTEADFSDPFLDAGRSAVLLDLLTWPLVAIYHDNPPFMGASLDLALWFHDFDPSGEWLLAEARSEVARAGQVSCQGRVFSEQGALLATSGSQQLCVAMG